MQFHAFGYTVRLTTRNATNMRSVTAMIAETAVGARLNAVTVTVAVANFIYTVADATTEVVMVR